MWVSKNGGSGGGEIDELEGSAVLEGGEVVEGATEVAARLVVALGKTLVLLLERNDEEGRSVVELSDSWAFESPGRIQTRAMSTRNRETRRVEAI